MTSPLEALFQSKGWTPFPYQKRCWQEFQEGKSGLCYAPTGTGKTLAVIGGALERALAEPDLQTPNRLRVLWITPLRALAHDTAQAIRGVADALDLPWRVEARTGDTPSSQKTKQKKSPPHVLVTTPESASLLMSYADSEKLYKNLITIVVDEWHELLSTKRGTQTELVLATIKQFAPDASRWALSATIENLDHAAHVLGGAHKTDITLVDASLKKEIQVTTLLPEEKEFLPLAGNFGGHLLPKILSLLEQANSTLLFTNTRNQAERWFREITAAKPEWRDAIGLHHGSLDKEVRAQIEEGLRQEQMRCVVCTSSLDLGVDFSPVEQVIQIGSPKGIARLLQRAGRFGHSPGRPSIVYGAPTHSFETLEYLAARNAIDQGKIEPRVALEKPIDVLAQHIVTRALVGDMNPDDLYEEVVQSYAYRNLTFEEWDWTLQFVANGGSALKAYPEYRKLTMNENRYSVTDKRIARNHRMSIGTITSDGMVSVKYVKGGTLGVVEESFIAQLRPRDTFFFSGKTLELIQFRDMKAYVKRAKKEKGVVPRWVGGRLPLSTHLGREVHRTLESFESSKAPEAKAVSEVLSLQAKWSEVPDYKTLLIEQTKVRDGFHTCLFPFEGRLAHEGLGVLLAYRISKHAPITLAVAANDYGLNLICPEAFSFSTDEWRELLSTDDLLEDLKEALNESEMAKRRFREIARVAGLIFQGYPGAEKTARQMQVSSGLLFDVLSKYDANNRLIEQAYDEVLRDQLEFRRILEALERLQDMTIHIQKPRRLTPFSFPLWAENVQSRISTEKASDRVKRMLDELREASKEAA